MHNNSQRAFNYVLTTVIVAIFGSFIRWLQVMNGYEADTGLPVAGSKITFVLGFYLVAAVIAFWLMVRTSKRHYTLNATAEEGLAVRGPLYAMLARLCAVIIFFAGLLVMLKANSTVYPMFSRALGAAGLVGGAAMVFSFKGTFGDKPGPGWAHMITAMYLCVWLVCCYRENADSVRLWSYIVEVAALICLICAHVNLAAYSYGKANPARTLLWCMAATVLSVTSLAGDGGIAILAMFLAEAGLMVIFTWIIVINMQEKEK